MERRGFLQALSAGAAMIMLPSLATEVIKTEVAAAVPAVPVTAAGLTAWMKNSFSVYAATKAAFMEVKAADMPKLYGFGVQDMPAEKFAGAVDEAKDVIRFHHKVICYGIEGDNPVEAERRLVAAVYKNLSQIEGGAPLFLRVEPTFSSEQITEYGDTWMTWEQVQDRTDLNKEIEVVRNGQMLKRIQRMPDSPLVIPEGVELDPTTESLKYVKRKYTLNKLRLRLSLPTLPEEKEEALYMVEGTRPKRI